MSVSIVTGAARGIGLATAKQMMAKGGKVAMVDRDADALAAAAKRLNAALPLRLDISDPNQVREMVSETVQAFGQVDHLVNNAGVARFGRGTPGTQENKGFCREYRLDLRPACLDLADSLRHLESCRDPADQAIRRRAWGVRHSRQLHLPRAGAHEAGDGCAYARYYSELP